MTRASAAAFLFALALCFALPLALPPAGAHFEETNLNAARLTAGPYIISFLTTPATAFERATTGLTAQIALAQAGTPLGGNAVEASVTIVGPGGFNGSRALAPDGSGFFVASVAFPSRGVYTLDIHVQSRSSEDEGRASTNVEVFPNHPWRLRPIDTALIVYANESATFDFEMVNATLLTRQDYVTDLTARIEHWADDHLRKLSEQEVIGTRTSEGAWRFIATPTGSGMHHFRFASSSGEFNYDESPPLHASVDLDRSQMQFDEPVRDAPLPSLALLALVAVLAALAHRRR